MTKEEFLIEATLRLLSTRPENTMAEIVDMANELQERTFGKALENEIKETQAKTETTYAVPISVIVSHLDKQWRGYGYGARMDKLFKKYNIASVGDLLRIGRHDFARINSVGNGSVTRIDDALRDLFNLESW